MNKLKSLFIDLLDLFFPNSCFNCQKNISRGQTLCGKCEEKLPFNHLPLCLQCGRSLRYANSSTKCLACNSREYNFQRNYSLFQYKKPLISLIYNLKYKNCSRIKDYLLEHLSVFLDFYDIINKHNIDIISCVPIHRSKIREREYNQSEIIAKALAAKISLPYKELLKVKRYSKSQTRINHSDRFKKVEGLFESSSTVNANILLIDDVFTSGATLNECSKVLKNNGAKSVITLTICSTLK